MIGVSQLLLILIIIFALFGAGKLPKVMGDIGKGIRNLKNGLKEEEQPENKEKKDEKVIEQ